MKISLSLSFVWDNWKERIMTLCISQTYFQKDLLHSIFHFEEFCNLTLKLFSSSSFGCLIPGLKSRVSKRNLQERWDSIWEFRPPSTSIFTFILSLVWDKVWWEKGFYSSSLIIIIRLDLYAFLIYLDLNVRFLWCNLFQSLIKVNFMVWTCFFLLNLKCIIKFQMYPFTLTPTKISRSPRALLFVETFTYSLWTSINAFID